MNHHHPKKHVFVRSCCYFLVTGETSLKLLYRGRPRATRMASAAIWGSGPGIAKRLGIQNAFSPNDSYGPYDNMFKSNLLCTSIIPINLPNIYAVVFKKSLITWLKGVPTPRNSFSCFLGGLGCKGIPDDQPPLLMARSKSGIHQFTS